MLDKDASKRFVHSALSSDQVYVEAVKAKQSEAANGESKASAGKRPAAAGKAAGKKSKRQRK